MKYNTKKVVLGFLASQNPEIMNTIEQSGVLGEVTYEEVERKRRAVSVNKPVVLAGLGSLFAEDPEQLEVAKATVEAVKAIYPNLDLAELGTVL